MARLLAIRPGLNSVAPGVEFDAITGTPTIADASASALANTTALRVNGTPSPQHATMTIGAFAATTGNLYLHDKIWVPTLPNGDCVIAWIGVVANVVLRANGALALYALSVQVGADSAPIAAGSTHRIELHVDQSGGTGAGIIELRLDGVSVASTSTSTTSAFTTMRVGAGIGGASTSTTIDIYHSHIVLNDSTGAVANSWVGDRNVYYLHPDAAGDNATWTIAGSAAAATNWDSVDEVTPDDGVTYVVRTATTIKIDDHNVGSPSAAGIASTDVIECVLIGIRGGAISGLDNIGRRVWTRIKSAASGTVHKAAGAGVQATAAGTASVILLNVNGWVSQTTASPPFPQFVSYTDPTTGAAWTRDGTNSLSNMQIGVQNESSATTEVRVTKLYAIVCVIPTPQVPMDETGTATDALTVSASTSDAETATGTDALTVSAAATDAESATGTDALTVSAAATDADSATASDDVSLAASTTDADSAVATDDLLSALASGLDETGTADDDLQIAEAVFDNDDAIALDALGLELGILDGDSAAIVDAASIVVYVSDGDTATVDDQMSVSTPGGVTSGWLVGSVNL